MKKRRVVGCNYKVGFTLIELLVVVALIALMSTLIIFSGDDGRARHTIQGAYEVFDVAMTQASVLSRSKQVDDIDHQNVHVVVAAGDPHTVSLYFDSALGIPGAFDSSEVLEEEYVMKKGVKMLYCTNLDENCTEIGGNLVFTWASPGSYFKIAQDGEGVPGELGYYQLRFKGTTINFNINTLGIIQIEQ